jgi:hypothetical protein
MTKRWRIAAVVVGIFTLAVLTMPPAAVAGGGAFNGGQTANSGVCKSGEHVRNMKACKEHGGTH